MKRGAIVLSVISALGFFVGLQAHEGHDHTVMGTVTAVDAKHIEVKTQEGKVVSARVNEKTTYFKGKIPATLDDVKVGLRVVLKATGKEENLSARLVRLPKAKTAEPKGEESPPEN